jgi:hypothetical protein
MDSDKLLIDGGTLCMCIMKGKGAQQLYLMGLHDLLFLTLRACQCYWWFYFEFLFLLFRQDLKQSVSTT